MTEFDRLHPALQHHIVNSLGWKSLRPLQESAIEPILGGQQAILLAPTAGGKTEAAIFPVLSRMLTEDWGGLSVLYVCPIKALLNNLAPRLESYAELVGRRVGLWHGDVGQSARRRILADPPDLLLTTPESIEVMLTSSKTDHRALFRNLQCVVVDEMHAFAGDDRGWHLLAVVERLTRVAGRDLQRLGLSATIGNAEELLEWLVGSSARDRRVIAPEAKATTEDVDVQLDYVGSLANAAIVISRLHRGEKRLVFCDSRSRVEQLAAALRNLDVDTYVSHSSLSLDERRRAESAFAEGRDAVIVATSTLELGIDVGDLDRVIQIDAPSTVASFLQRLGRTGRRAGTQRNCLFLATSENAFLRASGILELWSRGYVEPVIPPASPYHIFAQQMMALVLQEGGIGRYTWKDWLSGMPAFSAMPLGDLERILEFMIAKEILFEEAGLLSFGPEGERSFGFRNFMELMTVFTSDPLFEVKHGRDELGYLHPLSFSKREGGPTVVLLAGRNWQVKYVDWTRRIVFVEPSEEKGRSQWMGTSQGLRFDLCRAVRRVIADGEVPVSVTSRAIEMLEDVSERYAWIDDEGTAIVRDSNGAVAWWTFAGLAANSTLTSILDGLGLADSVSRLTDFAIPLVANCDVDEIRRAIAQIDTGAGVVPILEDEAADALKFQECLPTALALRVLGERTADPEAVARVGTEPVRRVIEP